MAAGDVSIRMLVKQRGTEAFDFVSRKLRRVGLQAGLTRGQLRFMGRAGTTAGSALFRMGGIGVRSLGMMFRTARGLGRIMFSLPGLIAGVSLALLARSFIGAASSTEQYELRLWSLLGTQAKANKALQFAAKVASAVPFAYDRVMEATVTLEAFGLAHRKWLPVVSDLAAVMGLGMVEASNALGRAYAGGAGAADIFRERGILNIIKSFRGIEDLSKLTLPEFRKAMFEAFTDPSGKLSGSSGRLAGAWGGMLSMMGDAWLQFRLKVMGFGPFDWLKAQLRGALDKIDEWREQGKIDDWAESWGGALTRAGEATKQFIANQIQSVEQFGLAETIIRDIEAIVPVMAEVGFRAGKVLAIGILRGYGATAKEHPIITTLVSAGAGAVAGGIIGGPVGAAAGASAGVGASIGAIAPPGRFALAAPPIAGAAIGALLGGIVGGPAGAAIGGTAGFVAGSQLSAFLLEKQLPSLVKGRQELTPAPTPKTEVVLSQEAKDLYRRAAESFIGIRPQDRMKFIEEKLGSRTFEERQVASMDNLARAMDGLTRFLDRTNRGDAVEAFAQ